MQLLKELYQLVEQDEEVEDDATPDIEETDDSTPDIEDDDATPDVDSEEEDDEVSSEVDDESSDEDEDDDNSGVTDADDVSDEAPVEDVGSVAEAEGYVKSKKEMFAFGKTRPVTLLTKNESLGGLDLTYQYVINPKTGAWKLMACLEGQSDEDMVEFDAGEDPSSLIANLKKKRKITPHQAVDRLNPPADAVVGEKTDVEERSSPLRWSGQTSDVEHGTYNMRLIGANRYELVYRGKGSEKWKVLARSVERKNAEKIADEHNNKKTVNEAKADPKAVAREAIKLARSHIDDAKQKDSAKVGLEDAEKLYSEGNYKYAHRRALDSLSYSVGIFHKDYKSVASHKKIFESQTLTEGAHSFRAEFPVDKFPTVSDVEKAIRSSAEPENDDPYSHDTQLADMKLKRFDSGETDPKKIYDKMLDKHEKWDPLFIEKFKKGKKEFWIVGGWIAE